MENGQQESTVKASIEKREDNAMDGDGVVIMKTHDE